MQEFDVAIIGAGAAGLFCAMIAGHRGRRVLLLDHASEAGAKILISGGGRCNFTNRHIAPERFLSANPHFCKSALTRYTQHDFIALVERHRITYHEKTLGQLFCDGSARAVLGMLLAECDAAGVVLRLAHKITEISKPSGFRIETDRGGFAAASLVLATGGLSIPKLGATGFAYDVARQFGLALTERRPALVPLTLDDAELETARTLTGLAFPTVVSCENQDFRESALFTHRGVSGPAILQISSYWTPGRDIVLDLLPDIDAEAYLLERKRSRPKAELKTILGEVLPGRLAQRLAETSAPNLPIAALSDKLLREAARNIKAWRMRPCGSEGYAKAEVTLGGIDTAGLSSRTMEARSVPGLYAIGEGVDVTGWLGGYNFQWAWSSGWCAGQAV